MMSSVRPVERTGIGRVHHNKCVVIPRSLGVGLEPRRSIGARVHHNKCVVIDWPLLYCELWAPSGASQSSQIASPEQPDRLPRAARSPPRAAR